MLITEKSLKKLRSKLPENYRQVVSKRVGCSWPTVHNVITGKSKNKKVLNALIELAKEEKKAAIEIEEEINNL